MHKMNWMLILLVGVLGVFAFAANNIVNYVVSGVSKFRVTSAGNTTIAGSLTIGGTFTPYSRTLAQINALVPTAVNQQVVCSDCVRSYVCRSSGTTTGAWTVLVETGTFVSPTHCI